MPAPTHRLRDLALNRRELREVTELYELLAPTAEDPDDVWRRVYAAYIEERRRAASEATR